MYVFRYVTIIATHRHRLYANFIKHAILIIFEYGTHQAFKLQNRKRLLPAVSALLECLPEIVGAQPINRAPKLVRYSVPIYL